MPTIYHVDPVNGLDTNSGASWALAWKTTLKLKTLYTGASISDVEIRFAKSPSATRNLNSAYNGVATTSTYQPYSLVSTIPASTMRFIAGGPPAAAHPNTIGWILQGSITGFAVNGMDTYSAINVPLGFAGTLAKSTPATGLGYNPSIYNRIEFITSVYNTAYTGTLSLNICSDAAGTVVVQSFTFVPPATGSPFETRFMPLFIGTGAFTSYTAKSITITTTATTVAHTLYVGTTLFTLAPTDPNYIGFSAAYLPQNSAGNFPKTFWSVRDDINTMSAYFYGVDFVNGDKAHTVYPMADTTDFTIRQAILPVSVLTFGTAALPVKFIGGYNTSTGLVDGLTCMDAQNLQLISTSAKTIAMDVSNIILLRVGKRNSNEASVFTSTFTEPYATVTLNLNNFHVAAPLTISYPCLLNRSLDTGGTGSPILYPANVTVTNCSLPIKVATATSYTWEFYNLTINNCRISENCLVPTGTTQGYVATTSPVVVSNSHISASSQNGFNASVGNTVRYTSCEFSPRTNNGTTGAYCYFLNCKFYGTSAVPLGAFNVLDNPVIEHTGSNQISLYPGDFKMLTIKNMVATTPASSGWTGGKFMTAASGGLVIDNCSWNINFAQMVATAAYNVSIHLQDSTFTPYGGASASPLFDLSSVDYQESTIVDNVTFGSGWTTIFKGNGGETLMTRVTVGGSSTVLFSPVGTGTNPSALFANRAGVVLDRIYTSSPNIVGVTAMSNALTPYKNISVSNVVGVDYPDTIFNGFATLIKDTTVTRSTSFTWKYTTVSTFSVGNPIFTEYLVGSFHVNAAIPINASVKCKRTAQTCRGWLFIRPLFTAATGYEDLRASSTTTPGSWEALSVSYTPLNAGAIEVYIAVTGVASSSVWFDDLSFVQI